MGRRRTKAPRRGSLAYLPRKRAKHPTGKVRHWPDITSNEPKLIGFSGYKVGMDHVYFINEVVGSPTYGQEVYCPITIVESPPLFICGTRAYHITTNGLKAHTEVWMEKLPRDVTRVISKAKHPTSFDTFDKAIDEIDEFRAIVSTQPRLASVPQKRPNLFEVKVDGGTRPDQLKYVHDILGQEIEVSDVFNEGQYVDIIGVTKGKGVQGPVKRWGVKILPRKSRKTVRGIGTLGPWSPHYVMYTVPRAGQMGFHQRTERNKRILRINSSTININPKGGFPHYGLVKSTNLFIKGSIPGFSKRLLKFRYAQNPPKHTAEPLKITHIGLQSQPT